MRFKILFASIFISILFGACTKNVILPEDPNTSIVWVVGDRTAMKSINAGIDWFDYSQYNDGILYRRIQENSVFHAISFYRTTYGLVTGYRYVGMSMNSQTWGGSGFSYGTFYSSVSVDSTLGYFCGEGMYCAEIQKVTFTFNDDGSAKWESKSISDKFPYHINGEFYGVDFISPSNGWVVGKFNFVFHTINGGNTWTRYNISPATPTKSFYAVYVNLRNNGSREVWIAGENGALFKASNDAAPGTWPKLTTGTTASLTSICFTGESTGYFTGTGGVILKTADNGLTFKKLNTGTTEKLNSISFMDENYGFAVGDKGAFLKTIDAGETWTQMPSDATKDLNCVHFLKRFPKR